MKQVINDVRAKVQDSKPFLPETLRDIFVKEINFISPCTEVLTSATTRYHLPSGMKPQMRFARLQRDFGIHEDCSTFSDQGKLKDSSH